MFWCWQHTSCCQHRLTARSKKIYSVLTHKASFFLMCILKGECCRWRRDPSAGVCILRLYSSFISKWFHFKSQTFPSSSHSRPRVHSSLVCLCFWKVKGRRHGGGGRRREKKKNKQGVLLGAVLHLSAAIWCPSAQSDWPSPNDGVCTLSICSPS